MHDKLIEMVLTTQMDDLNDAKMLLDYAEQAKMLGSPTLANSFATRAKYRLNNMSDCDHTLHSMLQHDDADNHVFATLYHKFISAEQERLKRRLDTF